MKIATYNINGIKARLPRILEWLDEAKPDVVLLQEIKSVDKNFPIMEFEDKGYIVETHGQKSFNGVAILSKFPLEDIRRGLPGDDTDEQARWIEATVMSSTPIKVCGLYLPNGNPVPGPKYAYKISWMERLFIRAIELINLEEPALMAGDYNVIPQEEDASTPENWTNDALFLAKTRAAYQKIINLGFTDAFRCRNPQPMNYTFWDFQAGAWNKNEGIRIDHFLLNPHCADLLKECEIDRYMRGREKPSDHVPIWVGLNI